MKNASPLRVLMMPSYRSGNPYQSMLAAALERIGVTVTFPSGYRRALPIWRAVLQAPVDVLHLHWLTPYLKGENVLTTAVYAAKLCCDLCLVKLSGVKLVWTIHNRISHEARFPRIETFVQKFVSRLANALIVHSEAARRSMSAAGLNLNNKRLYIIPHGHYGGAYSEAIPGLEARRTLGWDPGKTVFLYFGMVRPYKNIEGLIEAWRSLPAMAEQGMLVIAGEAADSAYRHEVQQLAEGIPGLHMQLSRIPDHQVHLYFSGSDVVVLPFNRILTSGSLLLAMSFGKPIVAPELETISETLQGATDLIYDSKQRDGLQKTLERAASPSTDLAGLSSRTKALCSELGWDRIALLTKAAYE